MIVRSFERLLAVCVMAVLMFAAPASAQVPAPPANPAAAASAPAASADKSAVSMADGYVLGVGDVIQVSVLGRTEFDVRVQVQNDNTILLPFINNITASNKTVLQLREEVRKKLIAGGFYSDPAVVVNIVTFASRYVVVLGAVGNPGIVPIDRSYRMSEILARAGGSNTVGVDTVRLTRADGQKFDLSLDKIATSGGADDPIVNPGDKIFVEPAKTFYIYGEIKQPGNFPIERGLTVLKAIARCGGLTPLGSDRNIKLIRDGVTYKKVDMSKPIQEGDVIVIGERFF